MGPFQSVYFYFLIKLFSTTAFALEREEGLSGFHDEFGDRQKPFWPSLHHTLTFRGLKEGYIYCIWGEMSWHPGSLLKQKADVRVSASGKALFCNVLLDAKAIFSLPWNLMIQTLRVLYGLTLILSIELVSVSWSKDCLVH